MKVLIACYSRSGHTARLAETIAAELTARGHAVDLERITAQAERNKWRLALPLLPTLPVLPLYLASRRFRHWWLRRYRQPRQDIGTLKFPDVSLYDCVCIGGPKWLYISYPVARYLEQVKGLAGKPIGAFATFCGPPLQAFEIDMLFVPLLQKISQRKGKTVTTLAISSRFHEFFFFNEMEYVFRALSRLCFRRPLQAFGLESAWGKDEVQRFCDELELEAADASACRHA